LAATAADGLGGFNVGGVFGSHSQAIG